MPPPKKTPTAKPVTPTPTPAPIAAKSEVKGSGQPKTAVTPAARTISHDQIAQRAYEIYASRGYSAGDQHADWLEAERQLKAGL